MPQPQAFVFLGNPGKDYQLTRHNIGFRVAERWARTRDASWQSKFKGEWSSFEAGGKRYALRPLTYMNLAGESVRAMGDFFKLVPESWAAVYDDVELPFGEVRFQAGGGLGGHNGLRSLKTHLGTDKFYRLRVGVGRPKHGDVGAFVLGRFTPDEEIELDRVLDRAAQELEASLTLK